MRIYIAGPITPRGMRPETDNFAIEYLHNIRELIHLATECIKRGHSPFCTGLDYQYFLSPAPWLDDITEQEIKAISLDWLDVSDAMLLAPGWTNSKGALAEFEYARSKKIAIYLNINEVPDLNKEGNNEDGI